MIRYKVVHNISFTMKTIYQAVDYVQTELQDPRKVVFNRTKAQLFYFLLFAFLTAEAGLYLMMHTT